MSGTAEPSGTRAGVLSSLTGLGGAGGRGPSVETLGYYRTSIRDGSVCPNTVGQAWDTVFKADNL